LQDKDFAKARELLKEVLKDPLISDIQADNGGSDHHLHQLRLVISSSEFLLSNFEADGWALADS
jgi:hypothetical protein